MNIINSFQAIITENPLFAGIVGLWGTSVLLFVFKSIPKKIFAFMKKQSTTELTLTSSNNSYYYFMNFLRNNKYDKKFRFIKLNNGRWGEKETNKGFGYGNQILKIKNKYVHISMEMLKKEGSTVDIDKITLTILGRNHTYFDSLLKYIREADQNRDYNKVYVWSGGSWGQGSRFENRKIDTIIMNDSEKKKLISIINLFYKREDFYVTKGIPYQLGIMLYGPPGTGKTSLIKALATYYQKDIYFINTINLHDLSRIMQTASGNCFFLIEDMDSSFSTQAREIKTDPNNNITERLVQGIGKGFLSNILNAMDGVMSKRGRILFTTTNHIEKIDSAILRPGRIDIKIEMGFVVIDMFICAMNLYYGNYVFNQQELCMKKKITMAQIQNDYLMGLSLQEMESKYLEKK